LYTGSNRWSPPGALCGCAAGNTEGKIVSSREGDPRNDSGVRSLDAPDFGGIRRRPSFFPMDIASYISGFVDGEGCFCVSFQPSQRHRFRWEVRPSFSVSQNADRAEILYLLQKRWLCGFIRPDRSDKTIKYEVRNVRHLVENVLPIFVHIR
jgi:hypothetical protein